MAEEYLPEHILYHIFLQMPTKSVLRLRCLSKQWNSMISDPFFIKSRSRRMIFLPSLPFHAIDNNMTSSDLTPSPIKLFSPLINPKSYKEVTVIGSFNGIVLLALKIHKYLFFYHNLYDHDMILYNPLSGEFKTLPHSQSFEPCKKYVYGFGYGTTTDDLKIVRLECNSLDNPKCCEVFGLKTWSWSILSKVIGGYDMYGSYPGTFANGFLYWKARKKTQYNPLILALDIKMMVFSKIKVPGECWLNCLGTYSGGLCMLCSKMNVKGYELRVMKEHGSWSTICSFTPWFTSLNLYATDFRMLYILDDGKLLMSKLPKQLGIYDTFKDSYKEVNSLTSFDIVGLQSIEYVESLISPSDICSVSI